MNAKDPKLVALQFNQCISDHDLDGLARLMTDDHVFIDREGCVHEPKPAMVEAWKDFFRMYPRYRNTFHRVESKDDLVIMLGEAYWSEDQPEDPAIWTATIADDRVREWHIYADTPRNRKRLHLA